MTQAQRLNQNKVISHTPGPWEFIEPMLIGTRAVTDEDGDPVLVVDMDHGGYDYYPPGCRMANARLIAAAPELLAALRGAMVIIDSLPVPEEASQALMDVYNNRRKAALAAIAKAEGRES